ncbi:hypothetical protein PoB_006544200 [Plakobranchus ocellatus]|uniref:Uncharacterized protein n=1 Tax=Plakobranchus ocellatus TaxID=259542 RepID=A0AAV4D488_9GAST|nr:hypothetical protein PoB_006544200 [Plakobranchus ocellatus]
METVGVCVDALGPFTLGQAESLASLTLGVGGRYSPSTVFLKGLGASVAQWLVSPPRDLQGPFCRGFEPRYRRPSLTEGLKA